MSSRKAAHGFRKTESMLGSAKMAVGVLVAIAAAMTTLAPTPIAHPRL